MPKTARLELRIDPEDLATIREAYAVTYPKHRLSFSAWLAETLVKAADLPPKNLTILCESPLG